VGTDTFDDRKCSDNILEIQMIEMPQFIFRVGITGHRPENLSKQVQQSLEASLHAVFTELDAQVKAVLQQSQHVYSRTGDTAIRLVGGMAAGTDLTAISVAEQLGWSLQLLLPENQLRFRERIPAQEQILFDHACMAAERLVEITTSGDGDHQDPAHEALGLLVLQNIDILIAVWDGKESRGKGGTADIVQKATRYNLPVIWLDASNGLTTQFVRELGSAQSLNSGGDHWQQRLRQHLDETLLPPDAVLEPKANQRLMRFKNERLSNWNPGLAYPLFQFMFAGRKVRLADFKLPVSKEDNDKQWQREIDSEPTRLLTSTGFSLFKQYITLDRLAVYYAQLYRSASVLNYCLAAVAVLMALMGLILAQWKFWWVVIEIILIATVLLNTRIGNRGCWHEKWLDYRQMAEMLRAMLKLCPLGIKAHYEEQKMSQMHRGQPIRWMDWYLAAVNRTINIPSGNIDRQKYDLFKRGLSDYATHQGAYHQRSGDVAHIMDHRLHVIGNGCLYGTLLSCLVYLGSYAFLPEHVGSMSSWITFFCALLPAFGAASFGLRAHGDYEGVAQRSYATAAHLRQFSENILRTDMDFNQLMVVAHTLNGDNHLELRDWRVTFERRPLAVPA
jgi:hypothetical protein